MTTEPAQSVNPPSRPRILFLLHSFGKLTGVELHVHTLARALRDRYHIGLAYPSAGQVHFLDANGAQTVLPGAMIPWPETPASELRMQAAFQRIVELFRPDLIHVQHFLNWPLDVLEQAASFHVPLIVSFHDYYAITPQHTLQGASEPADTFSAAFCQQAFGRDLSGYLQTRRDRLARSLAAATIRVAVSPFLERQLAKIFPTPFRLVEYGIDAFQTAPKKPPKAGLRFGYFGNLVRHKGWQTLIEAFSEMQGLHPGSELHVHGWFGSQPPPRSGVTYHGTYQPQDIPQLAAQIDVAVIPSEFPETYCLVLSEMWQAGLPVLGADIGALGERIQDGVNGKKFRPGDQANLAAVLCWFVENDSWRSWALPRPRQTAEMADDYDALYRECLAPLAGDPSLEAELLVVQICEFQEDGDGFYRLHEPSRHLGRLPGVVTIDCDAHHRLLPQLAADADILVLLGADADFFPIIEQRRAAGRATVFEANDYHDDLQPWNPLTEKWLERSVQDGFAHCLTLCDGVQTSTPELARRWRQRTSKPIAVFPNQLAEIPLLGPLPDRPLTVGWGGSPGHFADWLHAATVLQPWLVRHPETHLAVMTNGFAKSFFQLPPARYHFTEFGSLAEYLRFLDRLDIGIAPLLPNDYNRCRSDVKFLEYASHGVVGIYADLEPYRGSVKHGVTGFLYRTPEELIKYLDLLAGDRALREKIRQQAYREVVEERRFEKHISERVTFYRSFLPGGTRRRPIAKEILQAAVRQDQCLQLRKGEPERIMFEATRGQASLANVEALRRVVEAFPEYALAGYHLGRMLIDLGECTAALPVLEALRQRQPKSTRTLCELGRAYFLLKDVYRARQILEYALTANPYYAPGWFYLLRLLQFSSAADGLRLVEQARSYHPKNYVLALFGGRLTPDGELVPYLVQVLEEYAPGFSDYEKPVAGAAFAEAFRAAASRAAENPEFSALLERACQLFPRSAKLADLRGRFLRRAGKEAEACRELTRALDLWLTSKSFQAEYPQEDGSPYFWQLGQHILKSRGEGQGERGD
ncbi:MAG TPA: glycosyltransferase [Gemmataceae bacterium]|jgi:glycosyltransferase involved in cell wall biosynthesis|nr:glycosyltransferase [Gemmataceae bacterium]